MSATFTADRFRLMAELRAQAPAVFVPGIGMWAVTGYEAVKEVLSDEARFPASGGYSGCGTCPRRQERSTRSTARCSGTP